MKNTKILTIAFSITATIIGAGFATGKEIMIFFPVSGKSGILYLFISIILMFFISMLYSFRKNPQYKFQKIIDDIFEKIFYIFIMASIGVMLSAGGETLSQIFSLQPCIGAILTYIICILITYFGLKGVYVFNTVIVPIMIFAMITISLKALPTPVFLSQNSFSLAVSYCGYNLLSLLPFMKNIKEKEKNNVFIKGAILGFISVLFCSTLIKLATDKYFNLIQLESVPMIAISKILGKNYELFYSIIAYCAIITTAVSSIFCLGEGNKKIIISFPFLLLSFFGFDNLIKNVYSLFGYAGTIYIIYIVVTNLFLRKEPKQWQMKQRKSKILFWRTGKNLQ